MDHFYVYSFVRKAKEEKQITTLVIFCPYVEVKAYISGFKQQLRSYFLKNVPPDEIYILGGDYHKNELLEYFQTHSEENFDIIPRFNKEHYKDSIYIMSFDEKGVFTPVNCIPEENIELLDEVLNRGMVEIFNNRGGLIVAHSSHHFVFPSGKHCDRFLRTGNVLIASPEIFFIASKVLNYFSRRSYDTIYCDTSSINSLAFAVVDVARRFNKDLVTPHIESFGSYKRFEKEKFSNTRKSLFLVSSSTSGSIVERLFEHSKNMIKLEQIALIYGLNVRDQFSEQLVCNLSYDEISNPKGLNGFKTSNVSRGEDCKLCQSGSVKVPVHGDVFLLEKPRVNSIDIIKKDAPSYIRTFVKDFKTIHKDEPSAVRVYFKDDASDENYEIFIDIERVLAFWNNGKPKQYKMFFKRLEKFTLQNIPASVKYIIYLPDKGSHGLAKVIQSILRVNKINLGFNRLIPMAGLDQISEKEKGTIVIASACVVSGKNLLFLSKALRKFEENMSRVYFTALKRTPYQDHDTFLKSNLGYGEFGMNTHKVINVGEINCPDRLTETPWHKELEFIKVLIDYLETTDHEKYAVAIDSYQSRQTILEECGANKGLADNLFFSHATTNKTLGIRKGFAFADGQDFEKKASQSDVYFIMASILNHLRNSTDLNRRLRQTEYVRNLIAPGNFNRFNDGILQASILRAATSAELRYDLSDEFSLQIRSIIGDMIRNITDEHAEGVTEFFYAIAIEKLRLSPSILCDCIDLFRSEIKKKKVKAKVLESLVDYIDDEVCERPTIQEKFDKY